MSKKEIEECINDKLSNDGYGHISLDKELDIIIKEFEEWIEKGKKLGYSNLKIKRYNPYDICIMGSRLETDKEYERRMKKSKSAKKAADKRRKDREDKEKLLLAKLKEKYE